TRSGSIRSSAYAPWWCTSACRLIVRPCHPLASPAMKRRRPILRLVRDRCGRPYGLQKTRVGRLFRGAVRSASSLLKQLWILALYAELSIRHRDCLTFRGDNPLSSVPGSLRWTPTGETSDEPQGFYVH